jgi:antitoxin component YwqK of YwqJK toxin-antitoxin module
MLRFLIILLSLCVFVACAGTNTASDGDSTESSASEASSADADGCNYYFDDNLQMDEVARVVTLNGMPVTGTICERYPNGTLMVFATAKDGKLHGQTRTYYENGQLEFEGTLVESVIHGVVKTYREDGTLLSEETYENDVIVKTIRYDEDGEPIAEE